MKNTHTEIYNLEKRFVMNYEKKWINKKRSKLHPVECGVKYKKISFTKKYWKKGDWS